MCGKVPDRVPLLLETMGDDVMDRWRAGGFPGDADPLKVFEGDRCEDIPVSLDPRPGIDGPITSREKLALLRERLDPADPGRLPEDWGKRVEAWRDRDHVLQLHLQRGFFLSMGVHDWRGFLEAAESAGEEPEIAAGVMAAYSEFGIGILERVARDVEIDMVSFSEPIASTHGPLISPRMHDEICLSAYRPVVARAKALGVSAAVLVSWSNVRALIPGALAAGIDCLWANEAGDPGMDYLSLRREFGTSLKLIGGIDLDAILAGREAIGREVEAKVPALLAQGGYVPAADGRIRSNVPVENYVLYRKLLAEAVANSRLG
jgi:hypothetical protein